MLINNRLIPQDNQTIMCWHCYYNLSLTFSPSLSLSLSLSPSPPLLSLSLSVCLSPSLSLPSSLSSLTFNKASISLLISVLLFSLLLQCVKSDIRLHEREPPHSLKLPYTYRKHKMTRTNTHRESVIFTLQNHTPNNGHSNTHLICKHVTHVYVRVHHRPAG